MDVGPLFIPHTQAAKLIEPGKGALHDPTATGLGTAMLAAAHGQPRHDMPRPQPARAAGDSHPRTTTLLASRSGSHRSDEPRAAQPPLADQVTLTAALGPIGIRQERLDKIP